MFTFLATAAAHPNVPWRPDSFVMAVVATAAFGLVGIVLAFLGFKLFDLLTPGNLEEEVVKKGNVAAAIVAGAIIIGVCLIVAAAVIG